MIWRIWNYLNQELYWKIINLSNIHFNEILIKLNLIHIYDKIDQQRRINTNFLESFFEGFIILIILNLIFWKSKKFCPGKLSWWFLILYSIARFAMEFLRDYTPAEFMWPLTKTQYLMILFFILGIILILKSKNKCFVLD